MTFDRDDFASYSPHQCGKLYSKNNHACEVESKTDIHLVLAYVQDSMLHNVRYGPSVKKSLLLINQLNARGYWDHGNSMRGCVGRQRQQE